MSRLDTSTTRIPPKKGREKADQKKKGKKLKNKHTNDVRKDPLNKSTKP
jgi:hypothetical protein